MFINQLNNSIPELYSYVQKVEMRKCRVSANRTHLALSRFCVLFERGL